MSVSNAEIAAVFEKVADLLEVENANPFRVRAYRRATETISALSRGLAEMVAAGEDLSELPGIGEDLSAKIAEIVRTGTLELLDEIESRTPPELVELMKIPGLGPKRVGTLYRQLGIDSLESLAQAARDGKIRELEGFGVKTEEHILEAVEAHRKVEKRATLAEAEQIAEPLVSYLRSVDGVAQVTVAGSYRRRRETVGDLDILVVCSPSCPVMERFGAYEGVATVVSAGTTRSTVRLRSGFQVDLRVVPEESYGAALHYFTGSKAHNIAIRTTGVRKGLKINEYGVFRGETRVAGRTEDEVFAQVDLPFIPPELREDRGEIEAAREDRLPQLIELSHIQGDLHGHTAETDGRASLEEIAQAAKARGYAYMAVTDHSRRIAMAHGLDADRLARQIDRIDRVNDGFKGMVLLKGIEVDILEDGRLDLPDDILARLDLRICSIHSKFHLPARRQTERLLRAMDNPYFNILGHPSGRKLNVRPPYEVDMERVMRAAREKGCFLELNAQPARMDLADIQCRMARDLGVKVAISTDAHSLRDLDYMRFGVGQARRGWLEPGDVLNTRGLKALRKLLKR